MKNYNNPPQKIWEEIIKRPSIPNATLEADIKSILETVKHNGDKALIKFSQKFDGVKTDDLQVSEIEIKEAAKKVDSKLKLAIKTAASNIKKFHKSQVEDCKIIETTEGVECWRKSIAIEKVGLYIPGGSAPLFSTILMLGIPAKIAGCKEIILCTPPDKNNQINPAILYTASFLGIKKIFKVGGAQAIAAMAYGTESIHKVYKIFGPGNQFVTKAKELIQQSGVAIDMPAGPSELLIIADENANSDFVAADLLSQAEHGEDSQVVLVSNSKNKIKEIEIAINQQLKNLPRKSIAEKALENSFSIVFKSLEDCMKFSNSYAPEHLIINTEKPNNLAKSVINAGSVFLGNYSCESAGDYASGTNHTLPTNGFSKSYSGVSVDSFLKKITFQNISKQGIKNLGSAIEVMADAEGLFAHKNAISIRLNKLKK